MGIFDALGGSSKIQLSPRSAMILAALTMSAADGSIDDDEVDIVKRMDSDNHSATDWNLAIDVFKKRARNGELSDCIDAITESLNTEQRKFTIANLIDIAMADGVLEGEERNLLEVYTNKFLLDNDFVKSVVDVVLVKNDRSVFGSGA